MSELTTDQIIEAAIFAAGEPLSLAKIQSLFEDETLDNETIRDAIKQIESRYENSGLELKKVASGYRFQAKQASSNYLQRLWEKKPPRYTRALLETLALIVYRQPVTRGEIEEVRGVAVSSNIIKTLLEREWIKIVGHKNVPGKPALYATTREFLDYFNFKSLKELPELRDIVDLDELGEKLSNQLALDIPDQKQQLEADTRIEDGAVDDNIEPSAELVEELEAIEHEHHINKVEPQEGAPAHEATDADNPEREN